MIDVLRFLTTLALAAVDDSIAAGGVTIDTVLTLPEVRVERARIPSEARRRLPTAHVAEIALAETPRATANLSEALAQAAGVRIVQYGGLGAYSSASLRGAPPGQVAILLDGVPITSAAHGAVNLADLPATAIERVEVYRGLAPLDWGAALPGGAINLVTVRAPTVREARVSTGSFGTREALATAGLARGGFGALLHAGTQASSGDFRFLDDNDTPLNLADDATGVRGNNRFEASTVLGSLSARLGALDARLRLDHFRKHQGLPGRGANPAQRARLDFERSLGALETSVRGRGLLPDLRLDGALGRERLGLWIDEPSMGWGVHMSDDRFRDRLAKGALAWPRLPLGFVVEGGGSVRIENVDLSDAALGANPPPSRRRTTGAYAVVRLVTLGERLTLHAGRRWDRLHDALRWNVLTTTRTSETRRVLNTPQLGAAYAAPLGLELRANWTDASRAPELMELFGNQGATQGNPALVPERAESWDAGVAWMGALGVARGTVEVAHFDTRVRDLIVFVRNSPNSTKATNLARARVTGDELSVRVRVGALAAQCAATWQSAVDVGPVPFWNGKRLPQHPERQGSARLAWEGRRLGASADVVWIGENFLDRYNRQPVPNRALVGATLSVSPFAIPLRLLLDGRNLGDDRVADVSGYPLPGRSVYVSIQARSGPTSSERGAS